MEFVEEEIFGPVAVNIKFKDEDDVLNSESEAPYGLTAFFLMKDLTRGVQVANKVQPGTVWVNCINSQYPNVPYGGFKQSGIGRECGQYPLDSDMSVVALFLSSPRARHLREANFWFLPATRTSEGKGCTVLKIY
jgi:aldehyde dehydrogenase (NAD+)